MSKWRNDQLSALAKWLGIYTIFFMVIDLIMPVEFAAPLAFLFVLLAIMHPDNKKDRDAIKPPVIDVILEK